MRELHHSFHVVPTIPPVPQGHPQLQVAREHAGGAALRGCTPLKVMGHDLRHKLWCTGLGMLRPPACVLEYIHFVWLAFLNHDLGFRVWGRWASRKWVFPGWRVSLEVNKIWGQIWLMWEYLFRPSGKKRRKSSKHNHYLISPRMILKMIISCDVHASTLRLQCTIEIQDSVNKFFVRRAHRASSRATKQFLSKHHQSKECLHKYTLIFKDYIIIFWPTLSVWESRRLALILYFEVHWVATSNHSHNLLTQSPSPLISKQGV